MSADRQSLERVDHAALRTNQAVIIGLSFSVPATFLSDSRGRPHIKLLQTGEKPPKKPLPGPVVLETLE